MRANVKKSWESLSDKDRDLIAQLAQEMIQEGIQRGMEMNQAELQKIWIQYACIILNDVFDMKRDELLRFIDRWKWIYRKNDRFADKDEQTGYITGRLTEIFDGEFPYEFLDKLERVSRHGN